MFSIFNSNRPESPDNVHNGSTVTIVECTDPIDQIFMVSRYSALGLYVSWFAHVDEISNFNGAVS